MYLEVYPDIVFLLNLFADLILLLLLKLVNHRRCHVIRLLLGAAAGGFTAVVISLLPWFNYVIGIENMSGLIRGISFLIKVISLPGMLMITFGRMNYKELIRQSVSLFLITCFAGGLMNSVYYHTKVRLYLINLDYSIIFSNLPMWYVIIIFLCILPIASFLAWLRRKYLGSRKELYDVEFIIGEKSVSAKGLMDTGNCLYDPVSKKPVIVAERSLMEKIIPSVYWLKLQEPENEEAEPEIAASKEKLDSLFCKLHFIPYQSIGKERGVMLGIVLDRVLIKDEQENICHEKGIISHEKGFISHEKVTAAICNHRLSPEGEYQIILHKELLLGK